VYIDDSLDLGNRTFNKLPYFRTYNDEKWGIYLQKLHLHPY